MRTGRQSTPCLLSVSSAADKESQQTRNMPLTLARQAGYNSITPGLQKKEEPSYGNDDYQEPVRIDPDL